MAMLRRGIGHALRRSAPGGVASRFLGNSGSGSCSTTVDLALRRPAMLPHTPPAAATSPFSLSDRSLISSDPSRLEKRIEETKEELLKMYLQMHSCQYSVNGAEKVKLELNQLLRQFQAKTGSATAKRLSQADPPTTEEMSFMEILEGLLPKVNNSKELGDKVYAPCMMFVIIVVWVRALTV